MKTLDKFIKNWEEKAVEYYLELKTKREELIEQKRVMTKKYNIHCRRPGRIVPEDYKAADDAYKLFIRSNTKQSLAIIQNEGKRIKELVSKEAIRKKKNLVARIEKKAGKFVDCEELYIGVDGNINGYVEGEIKRVSVLTIYAGGYNIQCLHYRVLVK